MSTGIMSAAIANVRAAQRNAAAVTGLPPRATAIQSDIATATESMLGDVEKASAALVAAANSVNAPLDAAEQAVEAGNGDALKSALDDVQARLGAMGGQLAAAHDRVKGALDQVINSNVELASIGSDLAADITRAEAKAVEADKAAEELDKKKWYFLFLGPLGLAGLATCIGLIVDATNKANKLRQEVSQLRGQAAQQRKVQADLDLLRQEIPVVSGRLLSLQNGLTFIDSDTSAIIADVRKTPGSPIAKAFLLTTRHQVETLIMDAS